MEEELQIPKGIVAEQKLRFTNKGHASDVYNAPPGDILGTVIIKDHEVFRRKEHDIISEVPISIGQALLGGKLEVETIHGKETIEINSSVTNKTRYILREKGAPHLAPEDHIIGDHIVKFRIVIPNELSEEQITLIK